MSLLTIVQQACRSPGVGLPAPAAVTTSSDEAVLQFLTIANEEGQELSRRTPAWTALQVETTFTTLATISQGSMVTIAPNCNYIINDTIWDRDLRRPVFGPLTPQFWQQQVSQVMTGPWSQFRVQRGLLEFYPAPTAGHTCAFEYITKAWCTDSTGLVEKTLFDADTDVSLLDEYLMQLGVVWRWKQGKGLDYAEDYAKYERAVTDAMGRDGSKPILNLGEVRYDIYPGILVPSGSWPV